MVHELLYAMDTKDSGVIQNTIACSSALLGLGCCSPLINGLEGAQQELSHCIGCWVFRKRKYATLRTNRNSDVVDAVVKQQRIRNCWKWWVGRSQIERKVAQGTQIVFQGFGP